MNTTAKVIQALHNDRFELRHVSYLFSRLGALYPHTWGGHDSSKWSAMRKEWSDALAKYKFEAVVRGIEDLRQSNSVYPPTLPQFISRCEKFTPQNFWTAQKNITESTHEPSPILAKWMAEHPQESVDEAGIERAKIYLRLIREKIRGKTRTKLDKPGTVLEYADKCPKF